MSSLFRESPITSSNVDMRSNLIEKSYKYIVKIFNMYIYINENSTTDFRLKHVLEPHTQGLI